MAPHVTLGEFSNPKIKIKIFKISLHIPSPLPPARRDGGGCGWGWTKRNLVPPPLNLLPRGEERFLGTRLKMLEINSQTLLCKYLSIQSKMTRTFLKIENLEFEIYWPFDICYLALTLS
jgi:hypothetical protein